MDQFTEIKQGMSLAGVIQDHLVEVITFIPLNETSGTLYYKLPGGTFHEQLLFQKDLAAIHHIEEKRLWNFETDGNSFKLLLEAHRINLAYLFDPMMAVHTSNVQPLPHQITAVYDAMLPKQPLRFVLADDPGAGKTIMAGLLIRELLMHAAAYRILIVSPGSLTEQWSEEMYSKFGLNFTLFSRTLCDQSRSGNPFEDYDLLIARLDQLSRDESLQQKLASASWDLIIVDEAHKLSASSFGTKVNETKRYKLGRILGSRTRHFLLLTATPHNGKDADFQLFLALLDPDRFAGKFQEGIKNIDLSSIMHRMVKEALYTFDNTHLFPERFAHTLNYSLSGKEHELYEEVTHYVQEEMDRAEKLDNQRKGRVGFALTGLQRRLASSPLAIHNTLKRRKEKLEKRIADIKAKRESQEWKESILDFDSDDYTASEYEEMEERVIDQTTAAETIEELQAEIDRLRELEEMALQLVQSGKDRKWTELSLLLQTDNLLKDSSGVQRKLIVFTEYRDTLNYLVGRISDVLGNANAVVEIRGGMDRDERRLAQEKFRNDKEVRIMVATDAAGEGVNLQNANLMVNYDLPWNPNRIEQRFGRIHRIGQRLPCRLWNMVAADTREGYVFLRLFDKLEKERQALGGRVFDILGELFEEKSLRDMLIEAIRSGNSPEHRDYLLKQLDEPFDKEHIADVLNRYALCKQSFTEEQLFHVREAMEKAEARKLQPYYIRSFFLESFKRLGGSIRRMEKGRYEITKVPKSVRAEAGKIWGNENRILKRYERICFEKKHIYIKEKPGSPLAELIHPGHPLMKAMLRKMIEEGQDILKEGGILIDRRDLTENIRFLFVLEHHIKSEKNADQIVSRRLHFVELQTDGTPCPSAGIAPYLDYAPAEESEKVIINALLKEPVLKNLSPRQWEQSAISFASKNIVPDHFDEVKENICTQTEKIRGEVQARLVQEIYHQSELIRKYEEKAAHGQDMALPIRECEERIKDFKERLTLRLKELDDMTRIVSSTPIVLGAALIVPEGYLQKRQQKATPQLFAETQNSRQHIEKLAMKAVLTEEASMGNKCTDVSSQNCGWDITSRPPQRADKSLPPERHIEVKGRISGSTTITVTCNEICTALNQGEKYILALVFVRPDDTIDGPYYIPHPFNRVPDWGAVSVNYEIEDLLKGKDKRL